MCFICVGCDLCFCCFGFGWCGIFGFPSLFRVLWDTVLMNLFVLIFLLCLPFSLNTLYLQLHDVAVLMVLSPPPRSQALRAPRTPGCLASDSGDAAEKAGERHRCMEKSTRSQTIRFSSKVINTEKSHLSNRAAARVALREPRWPQRWRCRSPSKGTPSARCCREPATQAPQPSFMRFSRVCPVPCYGREASPQQRRRAGAENGRLAACLQRRSPGP